MKDLTQRGRENSGEAGPEPRADRRKEKKRKEKGRGARAALGWLAFLAAASSVAFLATFVNAGAGDPSAPDETLFSLLLGLRVSAVSLSAVSLVALGFSVNRLVRAPSFLGALRLFAYFFLALLGIALAAFGFFVVAITAGH